MQLKDTREIMDKINKVSKENRSIQTDDIATAHVSIQTKKIKQKNREIQVECSEDNGSKNEKKNNKSIEKIRK